MFPHCKQVRYLTFRVTDLKSYSSRGTEVYLDEEEFEAFTRSVAQDLASNVPHIAHKGLCVVLSDEEGNCVSVVPIDSLQ